MRVFLPDTNYLAETLVTIDGLGYSPQDWISIVGKLRPEVSPARAETALATMVGARPTAAAPEPVTLMPTASAALPVWTRAETERFVGLLVVVVGLIFLVGCANLAGLMLARNEQRRREAALRVALGVGRLPLLRLFITETFLLAGGGTLAGLLVSLWLLQALGRFVLPGGVMIGALDFGWTASLVAFGLVAAFMTVLLCGAMPALQVLRMEALPVLQGHPTGGRGGAWRTRGVLLAGQVAMTFVLVIGAVLFVRSLRTAVTTDVGVDADRIFYASVWFSFAGYDEVCVADFYDSVGTRLRGLPGVERVAFGHLPLVNFVAGTPVVTVNGRTRRLPQLAWIFMGGPGYVRTVGLTLQSGRDIGPRDREGSEAVALVNESLARHLWPERNALGRRFTFNPLRKDVQVVGIVRDGKYRGLREAGGFAVYLPLAQHRGLAVGSGAVIGRAARAAGPLVPLLEQQVRAFDPDLPISEASTLAGRIATLSMPQRMGAFLLGGLSSLALTLAVLGVYGSVTYAVTRRTREIGVRIALGAGTPTIVATVLSRTLLYVGVGIAAGLVAALALTGLVEQFLFGVAPRDPLTFVAVTAAIALATILAGLLPALRAARIAPAVALSEK